MVVSGIIAVARVQWHHIKWRTHYVAHARTHLTHTKHTHARRRAGGESYLAACSALAASMLASRTALSDDTCWGKSTTFSSVPSTASAAASFCIVLSQVTDCGARAAISSSKDSMAAMISAAFAARPSTVRSKRRRVVIVRSVCHAFVALLLTVFAVVVDVDGRICVRWPFSNSVNRLLFPPLAMDRTAAYDAKREAFLAARQQSASQIGLRTFRTLLP